MAGFYRLPSQSLPSISQAADFESRDAVFRSTWFARLKRLRVARPQPLWHKQSLPACLKQPAGFLVAILSSCFLIGTVAVLSRAGLLIGSESGAFKLANATRPPSNADDHMLVLQNGFRWTTEAPEPRFAYAQYATNTDYLINAIINLRSLERFGSRLDKVLIYPQEWDNLAETATEKRILTSLTKSFPYIKLRPFDMLSTSKGDPTWHYSLTKFNAFRLLDYTRVLCFDSDMLVLNNPDHLFLAPMASLAVPRAYWLTQPDSSFGQQVLGSHIMLLEPSEVKYDKIMAEARRTGDFDMEVVNHLFKSSAMILPHRRWALLTGEFRQKDHSKYLQGDDDEDGSQWNAMQEVSRAYFVHFSDWPLPKPWKPRTDAQWNNALPECTPEEAESKPYRPPCADRVMWAGFYETYDHYRNVVEKELDLA